MLKKLLYFISVITLLGCQSEIFSSSESTVSEYANLGEDGVVLSYKWLPLVEYAVDDLTSITSADTNIQESCYKLMLSTEENLMKVSFFSISETKTGKNDSGEEVITILRNYSRCGPAVTYSFETSGEFIEKNFMR